MRRARSIRIGAILRRHHVLDLELLLGGKRQQLVGRLTDLKCAFGSLAAGDDCRQRLSVRADIADDLCLNAQSMLER